MLLVAWAITVGAYLVGIIGGYPELVLIPQFVAIGLAILTVKRTAPAGDLLRPWLYRGVLVLELVASGACAAVAGGTVVIDGAGERHVAGLAVLATTNLLISILTWRALVRPAPQRAALVGALAVILEVIALIADLVMNMFHTMDSTSISLALFTSVAATWLGTGVSMVSLVAFGRATTAVVPEARVVDEG